MIAEALQKMKDLATVRQPVAINLAGSNRLYVGVPNADGSWKLDEIEPKKEVKRPVYAVSTLADAAAIMTKIVGEDAKKVVWIVDSEDAAVVGLVDFLDECSAGVRVSFKKTQAYDYFRRPPWTTHAEFTSMIRRDMPQLPTTFVSTIKKLKIEKKTETETDAGPHNAAMSRKYQVEASGAGALPEFVQCEFRPIENLDLRVSVRSVFEIDYEGGKVRLAPMDMELAGVEKAIQNAVSEGLAGPWTIIFGNACVAIDPE